MPPLILSLYFHPEPTGSAPPISDFALWLAERGEAPKVVTARPNYPDRVVFEGYGRGQHDIEDWDGVSVRRLGNFVTKNSGVLGRLVTEGSFMAALAIHRISGLKSSAVISVCPSIFVSLIAPVFVSRGGRHLVIVHDIQSGLGEATGASGFAMRLLRRLERAALNRADAIITLSKEMGDALRAIGVTTPIEIAPPQIDVRKYEVSPDPNAQIVVYSGAMGLKQGLHQILDAAQVLQSRGSRVRFVLRGQGGIKADLIAEAQSRGLENVSFEVLAAPDELNTAMALGSVHLVPQAAAGAEFAVPSKVFSIMACSRPFIATAVPGSPLACLAEKSQAGICVPPNTPDALADALEEAMSNDELRESLGRNGRVYVERYVDRSVVCDHIWKALTANRTLNDAHKQEAA